MSPKTYETADTNFYMYIKILAFELDTFNSIFEYVCGILDLEPTMEAICTAIKEIGNWLHKAIEFTLDISDTKDGELNNVKIDFIFRDRIAIIHNQKRLYEQLIKVNTIMQNQEHIKTELSSIKEKLDLMSFKVDANDPRSCLRTPKNMVSWYDGYSIDISKNVWRNLIDDQEVTITGLQVVEDSTGELSLNGNKVVTGTTSSKVTFEPQIESDHTIFNLCKYRDTGTKERILTDTSSVSGSYGFWDGKSGVYKESNLWITEDGDRFGSEWLLFASRTLELYRGNGIDYSHQKWSDTVTVPATKMEINPFPNNWESSDWACAELIFVNEKLTNVEIECVENYFQRKYDLKLGGVSSSSSSSSSTNDPKTCLTTPVNMVSWYKGDSIDITNSVWTNLIDDQNVAITDSTGLQVVEVTDSTGELFLNGHKVVTGTTLSKVIFEPDIVPDHTIFNLCKYRDDTVNKQRILQAAYNAFYGFHWGHSGTAYESGHISLDVDRFQTNWVLSASTHETYRNGQDLTASAIGVYPVPSTKLSINTGYAYGQVSDWACAEFIFVNERLTDDEIICVENYLKQKYDLKWADTTVPPPDDTIVIKISARNLYAICMVIIGLIVTFMLLTAICIGKYWFKNHNMSNAHKYQTVKYLESETEEVEENIAN
eukprot:76688_1